MEPIPGFVGPMRPSLFVALAVLCLRHVLAPVFSWSVHRENGIGGVTASLLTACFLLCRKERFALSAALGIAL
ncbi:MAG: hypothetical protein ACI906_003757 [Candidatus Latescibacterota bacterium]|jgi:hypothetical protein